MNDNFPGIIYVKTPHSAHNMILQYKRFSLPNLEIFSNVTYFFAKLVSPNLGLTLTPNLID